MTPPRPASNACCLAVFASTAAAACSANLVIDNYANWASHSNTLGSWTSDDSTMTSISKSGTKLLFTAKSSSYFYMTFSCINTATQGYNAIRFPIKAPAAGSSLQLEIQTKVGCTAAYTSRYYTLTGLGTTTTTVTVPLSSFGTGSVEVAAIVWQSFTAGAWEIGDTSFVCNSGSVPSSTATPIPVPSSTSSSTTASTPKPSSTTTPGTCSPLLIDDWASQSRLTFLYYNAMLEVSHGP